MSDTVTLYYNPMSRARTIHWALEEIGAPYDVKLIDFKKNEQKSPEFLAKNPMGKIPVIEHRGVVVSEVSAILAYLADAFPQARLAPPVDDPKRGAYYRWMFYASTNIEPAMMDAKYPRTNRPSPTAVGYGTADDVFSTIEYAIRDGYLLKDRFTMADLMMASSLSYGITFGMIPKRASFMSYVNLCSDRPSFLRHVQTADRLGQK